LYEGYSFAFLLHFAILFQGRKSLAAGALSELLAARLRVSGTKSRLGVTLGIGELHGGIDFWSET